MTYTRIKRKLFVARVKFVMFMSDIRFNFKKCFGGTFFTPLRERRQIDKMIAAAKRHNQYVVLRGRRY